MKVVRIVLISIALSAIALLQAIISVGIQINIQDNDLQLTFPESYNMRGYRDRRRLNYDNNLHLDFVLGVIAFSLTNFKIYATLLDTKLI